MASTSTDDHRNRTERFPSTQTTDSKKSHGQQQQQPAAVSEEDHEKENALGAEPQFSLAGPNTAMRSMHSPSQNIYEDPEYRDLNPQYGKSQDEPLWSLAQPLPRVVRPGMSLGHNEGGDEKESIATETVGPSILSSIDLDQKVKANQAMIGSSIRSRSRATGTQG